MNKLPAAPPGPGALCDFGWLTGDKPTFEWLVQARLASTLETDQGDVMSCLFRLYPAKAADWALVNKSDLSRVEMRCWAAGAPKDWLSAHPDLVRQWMNSDDPRMPWVIKGVLAPAK